MNRVGNGLIESILSLVTEAIIANGANIKNFSEALASIHYECSFCQIQITYLVVDLFDVV